MNKIIITKNQEETWAVAAEIAAGLQGGEILALSGNLGGGKTTFTKGLAEVLKVEETITSPTFVMLKVYPATLSNNQKIELVHIDAYRVESIDDIKSVGIEDYLNRDDIVMVVEWPEKIAELLPLRQAQGRLKNTIHINFEFIDENTREISTNIPPLGWDD